LWLLVAAFFGGLVVSSLGMVGQAVALVGLLFLVLHLFRLALQGQRWSFQSALILGCLLNAEVFIRDFAMRGLPAGYLAVEYLVILLGLASLPALIARHRSLVVSAPVIIFLCVCLWDSFGLFYSQDLWLGREITGLHWAGLACLLLGAVAFSREDTRRGLLDGIILGTFLSLGVMLLETVKSWYGVELDSQFRFGHALVSAVQVGIVLTTGMLACLLKLVSGYGKPRNSLISLALLAPFCIATFSRGPLLAFFLGALCLSLYRRRSRGWWKLPVAGLLLAVAALAVMWVLPSNFDSRYRELQGKDERSRIWNVVGEMWKESPIIGYGPGSWHAVYSRFAANAERAPSTISDAHNFIFQAAADGGVIGVGLFVLFLAALMFRIVRARSTMGLSLFVFIFVTASLANFKLSVLFLLLGAGLGDCLSPRRLPGQKFFPAGGRAHEWPAFAAGRHLVSRRFVYAGKRRPATAFRA
jgi:O-antigen ligase